MKPGVLATFAVGTLAMASWAMSAFIAPNRPDLIFSHKKHLEMDLECIACHGSVLESETGADNNLPEMEDCFECHDSSPDGCTLCHSNPDSAETYPRVTAYHERFSHKSHIGRKIECSTCHHGISDVDIATVANLPQMQTCSGCHETDFVPDDCDVCHEDFTAMSPRSHETHWLYLHREAAKADQESCGSCHKQDFCQACHQGDNLEGVIHDLNYIFIHPLDARGKEVECMSCHESRDFCVNCHRDYLAMPISHSKVNWSNMIPGDGGKHKTEARLDLESCAACHESGDADPICADCHGK